MIIKYSKLFVLSAALLSISGAVKAFELLDLPRTVWDITSDILPTEPDEPFMEPDWFDGGDHSIHGIRLSFRNFRKYYEEAHELYGYGMPTPLERTKAFYEFGSFALDNVQGTKTNSPPLNSWGASPPTPQIPLINRVVSPVNLEEGFRRPVLPPMRWTRDGRVGILGSATGVDAVPEPVTFHLNKPETLTENLLDNPPGITSLDNTSFKVPYSEFAIPGAKTAHTVAICDPTPTSNPYACGSGGQDDCYDVTLMGSAVKHSYLTSGRLLLEENAGKEGHAMSLVLPMLEDEERIFSRDMTVRVSSPKTPAARIEEVTFSDDFQIAPIRQGVLFEMNLPADGRIVVARRSGIPLVWRHTTTGQTHFGSYETVYAVAPDDAPACDASQFGELRPISHAPFDPLVKDKYPFAKYPFRDPMGNPVPDGKELKGTYPWLDMDAKILSLTVGDAELYNGFDKRLTSKHRYPSECLYPRFCDPDSPDVDENDQGFTEFADQGLLSQFAVMGAWTKGKMVVMDNMLNYSDFRFGLQNAVNISLYEPGSALNETTNKDHNVEVSASRDLAFGSRRDQFISLDPASGQDTEYLLKNTTFFDSIEHRMNFNQHMRPAMPQDVVWTVSSGATSDELSFDDMLNTNAFIVSEMVAAYSRKVNDLIAPFRMVAYDGWNELLSNWSGQVKVQNSATTLPDTWLVPNAGEVFHGRIEPVANGGIKGKGMYFNGENTSILYDIPANQPQDMSESSWFYSLHIEARELSTDAERIIIDFPDKSRLTLADAPGSTVVFRVYDANGEQQQAIEVPENLVKSKWFHLGIQTTPEHEVTFFVNGYPYREFVSDTAFKMIPGDLALGLNHNDNPGLIGGLLNGLLGGLLNGDSQGSAASARQVAFKGWMDDFKVFSYQPDLETACNFSHGTLLGLDSDSSLVEAAALYSPEMHGAVSRELAIRGQDTYPLYLCYRGSPEEDRTAVMHDLPEDAVSLREAMHFPEGPFYHDLPRPDSTNNQFCLSCHTDSSRVRGLQVGALSFRDIPAKDDRRRLPTQPPSEILGAIPESFVRSIEGNLDKLGSNKIDEYIQPSGMGVLPEIKNLVLLDNGQAMTAMSARSMHDTSAVTGLRANVNGVTRSVRYSLNGSNNIFHEDKGFELPLSAFRQGNNDLSVTAIGTNGLETTREFVVERQPQGLSISAVDNSDDANSGLGLNDDGFVAVTPSNSKGGAAHYLLYVLALLLMLGRRRYVAK